MYRLVFEEGVPSQEPLVVHVPLLTIGRDAACQVQLRENGVADHHARIERRADGYYLRDLNSPSGVCVNGRLVAERRLASGDELEIGPVRMRFEIMHDLPGGQQRRRSLDPLQLAAAAVVILVIGGQIALLGSLFSETRSKKMKLDTNRGGHGSQVVIGAEPTPLPTETASEPRPPAPAAGGAPMPVVLHRMIRLVRVDRRESGNTVTITVQAKAQVGERELDVSAVGLCVQFAALGATAPNIVWRDPIWLRIPAWENFTSKAFTVRFPGPPRELAGFVVRSYYHHQLQDIAAAPSSLQALAPIPRSGLAPDPPSGGAS